MNYKKIFKNLKEEIQMNKELICQQCKKKIISYGFLTSGYWFCSRKCLKEFRQKK